MKLKSGYLFLILHGLSFCTGSLLASAAQSQVHSLPLANDEQHSFAVQFTTPVSEHVKSRIKKITIPVSVSGFNPISTQTFKEVAGEKNEFVIIVVHDPVTGIQKSYEATSFVQFILANRQAKTVLLSPESTRLMNANLIYCMKYQANGSGQAPALTYLCSWEDILEVDQERQDHAKKREHLLSQNEAFLLNQLGGLEQWRKIRQHVLGGAVMRSRTMGDFFISIEADADVQNAVPLSRVRYVKSLVGFGFLCFLQGFLNNWNARRDGHGAENWAFYSKKCPWREFWPWLVSNRLEKEYFPQASESLAARWLGAGAQVLGECVPFPMYPYLWRKPVLTFRLFQVIYYTGVAAVQLFRE